MVAIAAMALPELQDHENPDGICDPSAVKAVQAEMLPSVAYLRLAETFSTLGDPTRLKIIQALDRAELCVHDLATVLDMNISAVSHQLRLLRSRRLVNFRKEGRTVYYSLDDQHIADLFHRAREHVLDGA